ncbi:MAG: hypothetical protein ACR2LT_00735 [Pyrinomonadaceae bacterium]
MEIIDSTNLTILGEIETVDEEIDGNYKYYIGVLNENVLIRIHNLNTDNQLVTFLYERVNHLELIARTEDVYTGKLPELNIEHFKIKKGKDFLVIGINSVFPHTSFKPIIKFDLTNNRRANIDGRESSGWDMYMSVETGRKMLEEMKRIKNQVVNQNK